MATILVNLNWRFSYNICFLNTINYIEAQKYLFGINGLKLQNP